MEKAVGSFELVMQKGIELVTLARVRDRARMKRAAAVQDTLREKSTGWNGAAEVRKWRDARYGPAGT